MGTLLVSGEPPAKVIAPAERYKILQSDELWKTDSKTATNQLSKLLAENKELGLEILIKRFDGWSIQPVGGMYRDPMTWHGREPYTLLPLVRELSVKDMEKL